MKSILLALFILFGFVTTASASDDVYIFFEKNRHENVKVRNALEDSLIYAFEDEDRNPHVVKNLKNLPNKGVLLVLKSVRATPGFKRTLVVRYKIEDLKSKKILEESRIERQTVVAGYGKLARVVGNDLAATVVDVSH